jgi:hypothetical protein
MAVVAVFATSAMAEAPVVDDFLDIIVGDAEDASANNIFVYPDAIDIGGAASDDGLPGDTLTWSFLDSSGTYVVNGKVSLEGGDDPGAPPAAKVINLEDTDPYDGPANEWIERDTDPETLTVRNEALSPLASDPPYGDPAGGPGLVDGPTALTLFCGDGDLAGSSTLFVYTDDDGYDMVSGEQPDGTMTDVVEYDLATDSSDWSYEDWIAAGITSGTSGGICMTAPAAGDQGGWWTSGYGQSAGGLSLANNQVYRIRLSMSSTQTTVNQCPLWDVIVENQDPGVAGAFVYGADYWFLDNQGGANAVEGPAVGLDTFDIWWTPPCVSVAEWQAAVDNVANAGELDALLKFRMVDFATAASNYGAELDSGTVCISNVDIDRIDIGELSSDGSAYEDADPTAAEWHTVEYGDADVTYDSSGITISPTGTWTDVLVDIQPGDTDFAVADLADNYPFAHEAATLYMMELDVSAPDANSEAHPVDFIILRVDSAGNELFMESYVTPNLDRVAMPTQAGKTLIGFFYSHNESLASEPLLNRLRARIAIGALSAIATHDNDGGITIEAVRVTKIALPD